jgi:hypothetical protein
MQGVRKRLVLAQLSDLLGVPIAELERATPRPRQSQTQSAGAHSELQRPQSAVDSLGATSEVSRARRMAERELLAVLIFEPHAGLTAARTDADSGEVHVAALSLNDFHDSQTRAIAEVMLPALHAGRALTVQQLFSALEHDACRRLVSELYFDGLARCGEALADALEAYAQSRRALQSCTARDLLNTAPSIDPEVSEPAAALRDLQSFLVRRRKLDHNPAAIAHGVRS